VHIRDTMPPGTVSGQPAAMTAIRGTSAGPGRAVCGPPRRRMPLARRASLLSCSS
jgi:hypothetical protein